VSDSVSWAERTVPLTGARRHPAAAVAAETIAGPELVVNHDGPEADPFADHRDYIAVRSIMGRAAHDACFIDDSGMPHLKPWAYYLGAEAHPAHRGIMLHWPGCRVEVTGDDLRSVYPLIMTRHAGLWRVFDARWHHPPPAGAAVIRSIRVIVTEDTPAR
jgi:hypothetical protein